ncbi:MAG: hypothetical protein HY538_01655 [Deltaproteobacteria bacterium]|nr:hypothetical protein [Deltaproteobacteria bacterium]
MILYIIRGVFICFALISFSQAAGNYPNIAQQSLLLPDGRTLELYHYLPDGAPRDHVLLWPGLGTTHFVYDLDRHYSLARYLQKKGMEVWVADSNPPTFKDWVEVDIPKALEAVQVKRHLAVIGLDVSGLAWMAYVSQNAESPIDRVVTLGTTAYLRYPSRLIQYLLEASKKVSAASLDPSLGAQRKVPFEGSSETYFDILVWDRSVLPEIRNEFLDQGLKPIPQTFMGEIQKWYQEGEASPVASLATWKLPILLVGGKLDPWAHPAMVRETYRHIEFEDKTYRLFSIGYQDKEDYSHWGLLLSRSAPNEVYPYIEKWLHEHQKNKK